MNYGHIVRKIISDILKWIGYLLLIVCTLGLVLALIGLIFKSDSLYLWGLLLSSPFFIIGIPFCLLLMLLFLCGSIYVIVRDSRSAFRKHHLNSKTVGKTADDDGDN